jgi:alkylhydroperoxidase/carboxymuconolactone decarboxylase family protein YurZ
MPELPEFYQNIKQQCPEVMKHYEALGEAARDAGPLDARGVALVKLGMAIGANLEGGTHAAVRKALKAGCTPKELRQAAVLAVTTLGFPAMSRARSWVEDVLSESA